MTIWKRMTMTNMMARRNRCKGPTKVRYIFMAVFESALNPNAMQNSQPRTKVIFSNIYCIP